MDIPIGLRRPEKCGYYGKHLHFFPSRKNHRQMVCNSALEADYCVLLEWDPEVVSYASQPGDLEVVVNHRIRRYRPDFQVETNDMLYFTEVKNEFGTITTAARDKLLAAQQLLQELGHRIVYADTNSIRSGWRLRNLRFFYFHSFNVSAEEDVACSRWLRSLNYPLPIQELVKPELPIRERAIYKALFESSLLANLNEQVTLNSLVEHKTG